MQANFTFLGTGASSGSPRVGCSCEICLSSSLRNQRLRPYGVVRIGDRSLLLDVGPDFRQQALKYRLGALSGLLLTHTHYDHIAGLDELRAFNFSQKKPFPCLLSKESLDELKVRYYYLFKKRGEGESDTVELDCQILPGDAGVIDFLGVSVHYMSYWQGGMKVNGYRIGNFAYVSDIREYDGSIFVALKGVQKLVLSALRKEPNRVHLSLDEAVAFARKVGAEQTWLTHLSHSVDHETACSSLPSDVQPGYDGLTFSFELGSYARN